MEGPRQIDRYRLLEEIGSGGMAVVYKGLDTALDREVAVKIMHPHLANRAESRRRFSREARAVARLRHPYILEIYDFSGDEARESYIVTEYVRGCTLRTFGDDVGFKLPEIAAMAAAQLAEALQAAHDAGIVHRDLKPENVMVRDDGLLKLMDFGIARIMETDEKMTMTGAMVGSPMHMAPEVIEGKEADVRADIFALGTILHWMVTGEMAFQGQTTHDTLRRILEGDYTDARMLKAECSDEIAEIIARCLRTDPADRFPNVAELREALKPVLEEAGLERVEPALKAFFADPPGYAEALRPKLVERLMASGEAALTGKRSARALSLFNRVLALDPDNAAVAEHLARMNRAKRRMKLLKQASTVALGLVASTALAAGVRAVVVAWPKPAPPPVAPPVQVETRAPEPAPSPAEIVGPVEVEPSIPRREPRVRERAPEVAVKEAAQPPPPPREMEFRWAPSAARLTIAGVRQAELPGTWEGELPVGKVLVELESPCCEPFRQEIEVKAGSDLQRVSLDGMVPRTGRIVLALNPTQPDAEVWLGTAMLGSVDELNRKGGVPINFDTTDKGMRRFEKDVSLTIRSPSGAFFPVRPTVHARAGTIVNQPVTVSLTDRSSP